MLDPLNILFRVDAGQDIGFGHLARCTALATIAIKSGAQVHFLGSGEKLDVFINEILSGRCNVRTLTEQETAGAENIFAEVLPPHPNVIIFDTAHHRTLQDLKFFKNELKAARKIADKVLVFDSLGKSSLQFNAVDFLPNDIVVTPYVGAEEYGFNAGTQLNGPLYFVLNPNFKAYLGTRKIRDSATRVLLTCGGSDVANVSAKTLQAINNIADVSLDVRVIIGPGFPDGLIEDIERFSRYSPHQIECLRGRSCLAADMNWCDICVSMSGLTKYELAATGTPAILLSIDKVHADAHQSFNLLKTSWHLGAAHEVSVKELQEKILSLLVKSNVRTEMSNNGQTHVAGDGSSQILEFLERHRHVGT